MSYCAIGPAAMVDDQFGQLYDKPGSMSEWPQN